jgi:site-specific recombinase XerD
MTFKDLNSATETSGQKAENSVFGYIQREAARLKEIGELAGCSRPLTTYVSRHSWGSAAKTNNVPISVICESMGHSDEKTTQIYLASLDTSVIDEANAEILKKL